MSEWYRKSLSEKQKIAQDKLRQLGKYRGGKCDYGFDIGENNELIKRNQSDLVLN